MEINTPAHSQSRRHSDPQAAFHSTVAMALQPALASLNVTDRPAFAWDREPAGTGAPSRPAPRPSDDIRAIAHALAAATPGSPGALALDVALGIAIEGALIAAYICGCNDEAKPRRSPACLPR